MPIFNVISVIQNYYLKGIKFRGYLIRGYLFRDLFSKRVTKWNGKQQEMRDIFELSVIMIVCFFFLIE